MEELAADRIERLIEARFKGHGLTALVEAILRAEGYTTYRSPEGADGGADILAGGGELGFGRPQICVEVKSGSDPVDRPTVDKLIGAGQKFGAETCLFVSWGGFRPNVQKDWHRNSPGEALEQEGATREALCSLRQAPQRRFAWSCL